MNWVPGAHASTFGGNPVCIAASIATLGLLERQYMANAARMGDYIMKRTADWREKHKIVGEVRGKGLMIGIEFVRDQKTKEKAGDLRNKLVQMAFHKGLLVLGSGDTTLRLCPPLLIDEAQADFALDTLETCITELERSL
jgi:4-aminobutyrate aminotransferase